MGFREKELTDIRKLEFGGETHRQGASRRGREDV